MRFFNTTFISEIFLLLIPWNVPAYILSSLFYFLNHILLPSLISAFCFCFRSNDLIKEYFWKQGFVNIFLHDSLPCCLPREANLYEPPQQSPLPSGFWWIQPTENITKTLEGWRRIRWWYLFHWFIFCSFALRWLICQPKVITSFKAAHSMLLLFPAFGHHSPCLPFWA